MYQALYRKYRPQTFSDVVGQKLSLIHICRLLARAVGKAARKSSGQDRQLFHRGRPDPPDFAGGREMCIRDIGCRSLHAAVGHVRVEILSQHH